MKLNSKLPSHYNGVAQVESSLLEDPKTLRIAIVQFNCSQITTDTTDNEQEATITIRRIELVEEADVETVREIYQRTLENRVGVDALPFDEERDAKDNGVVASEAKWQTIYEASIYISSEDALSGEWTVIQVMLNSEAIDDHEATYVQVGNSKRIFNASELTDLKAIDNDPFPELETEETTESTDESETVEKVIVPPVVFTDKPQS